MQFDIIDHNVSITTNVFLVIANIINLFYNIPQMYKTYKCKSTKDFSPTFLLLRVIGNTIWIEYAIEVNSFLMLLNNIVTVFSSLFIGYYKLNELLQQRKNINAVKQQELELNTVTINNDDENQNGDSSNDGSNDDKNKLIR
jgi:MtN3 and saliva related transmembrane protein